MDCEGVPVQDTFAEAFTMWATRLVVTAVDDAWAEHAAAQACGDATSVIGCDTEAAVERVLGGTETPDGRPGRALLMFAFKPEGLEKAVNRRTGQCLMTCPTTAVYDGLPEHEDGERTRRLALGKSLRYFGDGFQKSKVLGGRRYWRVPVMDGEFLVEQSLGAGKAVAGGNFLLYGRGQRETLAAARDAVGAIAPLPDAITPFPGGAVRSGSKIGARYKGMMSSTNDTQCPSLRSVTDTALPEGARCVYELVINGLDRDAVARAMGVGIRAACAHDLIAVGAGHFGGALGRHTIPLREALEACS
jgi:formylmethanofuran--tetrahydromethanopterin N-formyltransferase